jgi:hypothetical protein
LSQRSSSDAAFAPEIAGWVVMNVAGKISWELAEFEYVPTDFHNGRQDNLRFGTAVVFRFQFAGLSLAANKTVPSRWTIRRRREIRFWCIHKYSSTPPPFLAAHPCEPLR